MTEEEKKALEAEEDQKENKEEDQEPGFVQGGYRLGSENQPDRFRLRYPSQAIRERLTGALSLCRHKAVPVRVLPFLQEAEDTGHVIRFIGRKSEKLFIYSVEKRKNMCTFRSEFVILGQK